MEMTDSEFTYDAQFDAEVGLRDAEVPCKFITGQAGTGKTHKMREEIAADPTYGVLASTTGISAVNLGTITLNSLIGYFDTDSLRDKFLTGRLTTVLHQLALQYRNLVIDECSMMDAQQIDYIFEAMRQANGFKDVKEPMGIILVGDMAQLPAIKCRQPYEADCWSNFDANTERLTRMWRQDEPMFLMALNAARRGDGNEAARLLTEAGVRWETSLEMEFDGTTIVSKNDAVDRYNWEALSRVRGQKITVRAQRWGKQRGDWRLVPDMCDFKIGAYVMLLANKMEEGEILYANGDCGHIVNYERGLFDVELVRKDADGDPIVVSVGTITRNNDSKDRPDGWYGPDEDDEDDDKGKDAGYLLTDYFPKPHIRGAKRDKRYVIGQVRYYPMRLAYASTVHKVQGLSLDRIQVDVRNPFFSAPSMEYVALSRARTLGGLRIVGMMEKFARNCKVDPKVARWL